MSRPVKPVNALANGFGKLLHFFGLAGNREDTKKGQPAAEPNRIQIPLVIESRKSAAAAASQQSQKSHYKRKWRRCVRVGAAMGVWIGNIGTTGLWRSTPKAHVTRGPRHTHTHSQHTAANKRWQPQWQPTTAPPVSPAPPTPRPLKPSTVA